MISRPSKRPVHLRKSPERWGGKTRRGREKENRKKMRFPRRRTGDSVRHIPCFSAARSRHPFCPACLHSSCLATRREPAVPLSAGRRKRGKGAGTPRLQWQIIRRWVRGERTEFDPGKSLESRLPLPAPARDFGYRNKRHNTPTTGWRRPSLRDPPGEGPASTTTLKLRER